MALAAATVWEVRTGGSDTNGGGFKTGATGTDWTLQDAAQYSVTDGVTAGTTTITSATANFGTDVVGNIMYVQGGTGSVAAGWYEITARTNSTTITVDRSTGLTAGTGVTLKIGGALATPGLAASLMTVAGHTCYVKAGTYTITTATPGASGPVSFTAVAGLHMEGYSATRGDLGTAPVINAGSVTSAVLIDCQAGFNVGASVVNMGVDGNSQTGIDGFRSYTAATFTKCYAQNCKQSTSRCGFVLNTVATFVHCWADNCGIGFYNGGSTPVIVGSRASNCTSHGFQFQTSGTKQNIFDCISDHNAGNGFDATFGTATVYHNCTADNNTGDGFDASGTIIYCYNCAATNNGGYGFNTDSGSTVPKSLLVNCASYSNSSGRSNSSSNAPKADRGAITLSGVPWQDASTGDYRPDNTTNEGALLRAAGFDIYGQTDSRDVGAVQHADPGGGSASFNPFASPVIRGAA